MKIPLVDLKAQYKNIRDEINKAVIELIDSGNYILGKKVAEFESAFSGYCQTKHAVGVGSGTAALHLALLACDVGTGDEVLTTTLTFAATAEAIAYVGAKPVFIDIDPESYNIDPEKIEHYLNKIKNRKSKVKAIIPVHLYGQPADMEKIIDIARKYNLKVIEDAAQAHGAEIKSKRIGSIGDVGCFSFFPAKNLGACGDAGCVVTNDDEIAAKVRLLRDHGRATKYEHKQVGYNYRIDALQSAILLVKLMYLDKWTENRRKAANWYNGLLKDTPVKSPKEMPDIKHVYHLYVVQSENRDKLREFLSKNDISTGIHYPIPLHLQEAFKYAGYKAGDLPVSEHVSGHIVSLPMYPELTYEQVSYISSKIAEFFK